MDPSTSLEFDLGISPEHYSFDQDNDGNIIELSFFDDEYYEMPAASNLLQVVAGFPKLRSLSIDTVNNEVSDLMPLVELKELEHLDIQSSNTISDLSPLAGLTRLKSLSISAGEPTNVSCLHSLVHLESLSLPGRGIEDISFIARFTSLKYLVLYDNRITDIQSLSDCTRLEQLTLDGNAISNITSLARLARLKSLNLSNNQIEDITPIASLPLERLNLANNRITDAGTLHQLSSLTDLQLQYNRITDISFLTSCKNLQHLNITGNPVRDTSPLTVLTGLQSLSAGGIKSFNGEHIRALTNLRWLQLPDCGLNQIGFAGSFTQLMDLKLDDNSITDVSPILNAKGISRLSLQNNPVEDLYGFPSLYGLNALDLRRTSLGDAVFVNYLNGNEGQPQRLFPELNELLAVKCLERNEIDKAYALAFHSRTSVALEVLLQKLEKPAGSLPDVLHRHYILKAGMIINLLKAQPEHGNMDEVIQRFTKLVEQSHMEDREQVIAALQSGRYYLDDTNRQFAAFLSENKTDVHPEILYEAAVNILNREKLPEVLPVYKVLVEKNYPLQYNLYRRIREILQMHFAYTPEERRLHDKYRNTLDNILASDVGAPTLSTYRHNYRYVNEDRRRFRENYLNGQMVLRYVILIFLFIALIRSCGK